MNSAKSTPSGFPEYLHSALGLLPHTARGQSRALRHLMLQSADIRTSRTEQHRVPAIEHLNDGLFSLLQSQPHSIHPPPAAADGIDELPHFPHAIALEHIDRQTGQLGILHLLRSPAVVGLAG